MPSSVENVSEIWRQAEVVELISVDGCGGFNLKENTYQIFSLNPEEDYEVNYHTINGWRLVIDGVAQEYFASIEALKGLGLVLDQQNGSVLVQKLNHQDFARIQTQLKRLRSLPAITLSVDEISSAKL